MDVKLTPIVVRYVTTESGEVNVNVKLIYFDEVPGVLRIIYR